MNAEEACNARAHAVGTEMLRLIRDFLESEDRRGTSHCVSAPAMIAAVSCVLTEVIDIMTDGVEHAIAALEAICTTGKTLLAVRKERERR